MPSRAEPSQAERSRAEPSRAERSIAWRRARGAVRYAMTLLSLGEAVIPDSSAAGRQSSGVMGRTAVTRSWTPGSEIQDLDPLIWNPGRGIQGLDPWIWNPGPGIQGFDFQDLESRVWSP